MEKFKIGDVVKLKSGGPNMTVTDTDLDPGESYWCQWFAGSKEQKAHFPADALLPVTEEPRK